MFAALTATALRTGHAERSGDEGGADETPGRDLAWLAIPAGFVVAAIPFSNLMARWVSGVDLRDVGTGTVSGTGLFEVAGFAPLAAAGILEVAKGAVGPLLAGKRHPAIAAAATAAAVVGHNWSPFLQGAGGRGLSPAIGALGVTAPASAACLLGGMAGGRVIGQTAVGSLVGDLAALPVARRLHGGPASWTAAAAVVPMVLKRLTGNRPATNPSAYLWRLIFDRDTHHAAGLKTGSGR